jgi:hypothetical protein
MPAPSALLKAAALTLALQLPWVGTAWGRALTLEASTVCDLENGTLMIQYTVTSWSQNAVEGENSQVDVLFDGVVVDSQAFVYPGNSFSGAAPAPPGKAPGETVVVAATAVADWANGATGGQTTSITVTIPEETCGQLGVGRFTGGGFQVRVGDAKVTRGLTIHCDLLLSNNLQVNWGGKKFHMTTHLTTVECSDDPLIDQTPPAAPLDTLIGTGTGRYNGQDGYTIHFTLVDAGEPGTDDQMRILIFETADPGHVVLDVPLQNLTGGNLQAHYDQPHK